MDCGDNNHSTVTVTGDGQLEIFTDLDLAATVPGCLSRWLMACCGVVTSATSLHRQK